MNSYMKIYMKKFLFTLSLLVVTTAMMAVPAKRGQWKTLKLQDGTEVRAMLVGDEHGHFWRAADGQAYAKQSGTSYYTAVDAKQIAAKAKVRRQQVNAQRAKRLRAARRMGDLGNYFGKKRGIIILVNFQDKQFQTTHDNTLFNRIANEEGFSEGNFKGSMADYFKAQSRGLFELDFGVVGPVTVSQNASYYGENVPIEGSDQEGDKCAEEMVIEAVTLAKDLVTDWKQYDWNNDGEVDQVYLIYAGKGEADPGEDDMTDAIWPHAYTLYAANYYGVGSGPITVGTNLVVNTYACGSELNGEGDICGIGTMCHEFSHCLGYPDYYDIDYSGGQGMGGYDLMDSGSYNGNGYQPVGYTSYERWVAGWLEPIELNAEDAAITNMKSLQNGGESYIIYNKGNQNEFFLLENRQKDGWDASLSDKGLLILHCDYDKETWWNNQPNDDPDHQRMTVIPADGEYAYEMYKGEKYYYDATLFPYGSVTAFNKSFKVKKNDKVAEKAAKFFNKNTNGTYWIDSSVENIKQNNDGSISFNFVANYGGSAEEQPTGNYLFYESFDQCEGTGGNDDYWSGQGTASGAFSPDNEGWAADSKAGANQCAKFGSSKKIGTVTTPTISLTSQSVLTFKAAPWSGDVTSLKLSAIGTTITFDKTELTMRDGQWTEFTVKMTGAGDAKIVFTPGKRFFLDEVLVVDPNATAIQSVSAHKEIKTMRVYTLDGRYVGNDPDRLPRGMYIINGKKIVK